MLNTIGSPPYSNAQSSGASSAALEAQLDQCQRQLSDWVNCSSAKTPEGKDKIQALTNRISEIKTRMEKTVTLKPGSPSATLEVKTPANLYGITAAPKAGDLQGTTQKPATGGVGGLLDVFA